MKKAAKKKTTPVAAPKKTKAAAAPAKANASAAATHDAPDARLAYEYFLPAAMRLRSDELVGYRAADPTLARHNCEMAVAALAPLARQIRTELPLVATGDLESLPRLALAVEYAALDAARAPGATEIKGQLAVASALRGTLLAIADGLARAGLLPAAEVAQIRKGRGPIDSARDCLALAALFEKHEKKIAGKHAATAQMLKGSREVGSWLLTQLKPGGAKPKADAPTAAHEARDRLWSLLVKRHAEARKVAYWIWGDAFSAHVPPLLARHQPKPHAATAKTNGASQPAAPPPS